MCHRSPGQHIYKLNLGEREKSPEIEVCGILEDKAMPERVLPWGWGRIQSCRERSSGCFLPPPSQQLCFRIRLPSGKAGRRIFTESLSLWLSCHIINRCPPRPLWGPLSRTRVASQVTSGKSQVFLPCIVLKFWPFSHFLERQFQMHWNLKTRSS